jgi:hypothetical protein
LVHHHLNSNTSTPPPKVLNSNLGCYIFQKTICKSKYANIVKHWQSSFTKYLKAPKVLRIYPSFKPRNIPHTQEGASTCERRFFVQNFDVLYAWEGLLPEGSSACKSPIHYTLDPQGVCHIVALPFTLKKASKGKTRIMETQLFHHAKKDLIFKNPFKRNQKPSKIL